jgi:tetratricopeptide (TPR) repeat protein
MNSHYADVNNKLGLIYHENGNLEQAADFFKKALSINPHYTEASLNLTIALNDLGQYDEARTTLSKAALSVWAAPNAIDPYIQKKLAAEHARLGDQYIELGILDEGVEQYQKTLRLCPDFIDVVIKLAVTLRTQGKDDEAIDLLTEARKRNPSYVPAMIQLGLTYYRKGFIGLAYGQWKDASKIDPNHSAAQAYLRGLKMQVIAE